MLGFLQFLLRIELLKHVIRADHDEDTAFRQRFLRIQSHIDLSVDDDSHNVDAETLTHIYIKIGRASCRERV